ncbi:MAG: hypothetical protein ACE5HE_04665 [Phycisphaerae bacterium]
MKHATTAGAAGQIPPVNDNCANQTPISGPGPHPFDNTSATVEPGSPSHDLCALWNDPTIIQDVWYCWTAPPVTETVELNTCGQAVDTKIAVYQGCNCLPTDANLLTCNDDACDLSTDYGSSVTFEASANHSYLIRVGTLSLFNTPGGVGSFTIDPVALPCGTGPTQSCQQPSLFDARRSNRTTDTVVDDFTPTTSGTIADLCWWGMYSDAVGDCKGAAPDQFVVRYYDDAGGTPGTLLAEFTQDAVDPAKRLTVTGPTATPRFIPSHRPFYPEYEYSATHPPVGVTADTCYWVEISNTVASWCDWYWELGGADTGRALWDRDGVDPPVYETTDVVALDQALCLDIGGRNAAQQCLLQSPCAERTTDCCIDNTGTGTVGCGDVNCCERVCACDPFCCAVAWDDLCAGTGTCGAATLCTNLCGACPVGDVMWSSGEPPTGVVDARQPHEVANADVLLGIRRVTVAAPAGASQTGCWDVCETEVDGTPNFIRFVLDNLDGTFTATLNRRISPGAITQISYAGAPTGTRKGTYVSLPGDSNGDHIADSRDLATLVNCCLDGSCTPPHGVYSCDINHSGLTTSEDLVRQVDLFNAGGAFTTSWLGATPGVSNPCP